MVLAKRNKDGQIILNPKIVEMRKKKSNHLFDSNIDYKVNEANILTKWEKIISDAFYPYQVPKYVPCDRKPRNDRLLDTYNGYFLYSITIMLKRCDSAQEEIRYIRRKIYETRKKFLNIFLQNTEDDYYFYNTFSQLLLYIEKYSKDKLKELKEINKLYTAEKKELEEKRKIFEEEVKKETKLLLPWEFKELWKKKGAKEI